MRWRAREPVPVARSGGGPAAVDDEDLSGHVARGSSGEEEQRPVDLFEGGGPSEQTGIRDLRGSRSVRREVSGPGSRLSRASRRRPSPNRLITRPASSISKLPGAARANRLDCCLLTGRGRCRRRLRRQAEWCWSDGTGRPAGASCWRSRGGRARCRRNLTWPPSLAGSLWGGQGEEVSESPAYSARNNTSRTWS